MTSLSKSFCISFFPVKCMRSTRLGRLTSASSLAAAAASSTMLSSMCCGITAKHLHVSSVAASHHFCQRVPPETLALDIHGVSPSPRYRSGLTTCTCACGRRCVHSMVRSSVNPAKQFSQAFQVLARNSCPAARIEASALSPSGASSSRRLSSPAEAMAGQAVAEPPLTTGEEFYKDEYEASEAVLKFLKSEQIETAELEAVALPPSVAVMTERIIFLTKIGLSKKDINDYPLMLGGSVKKNFVPVLSYLEKLNVESKFLPDLIRKYPMVLNSSVTMDLEPVVTFLMGIGVDRLSLGRVLTRFPDVLGFKIEGTMSTSIAYLVSLGVNMREVGPMITEYPEILGMRVGNNIKPKVDYLLSLGIPKEVLAKVLEVKPFILGFDLENKMKPAIQDLRDLGVRESSLSRVLVQYADVLGLDIKLRLETKLGWLVKHAGVKREDIGQILEKLPQILAVNIALAQSRVTFLTNEGFSVEDIGVMVTKCPPLLALSIDEGMKPHLSFFVNSIKRPLSEIVDYPFYFTYNLEKRIRPRYIQIEQKGIQCSLSWFLNCTDAKFSERLLLDFVEKPGMEEVEPLVSMGGRVRIKGEDVSHEASDDESNNMAAES